MDELINLIAAIDAEQDSLRDKDNEKVSLEKCISLLLDQLEETKDDDMQ